MIKKQWQTAIDHLCQLDAQVQGDLYDDIVWDTGVPLYTAEELTIKYNEIKRTLLAWQEMIDRRNALLQACDWTQAKDIPNEISQVWVNYRQQLRDLPDNCDPWVEDVVWPTKPA